MCTTHGTKANAPSGKDIANPARVCLHFDSRSSTSTPDPVSSDTRPLQFSIFSGFFLRHLKHLHAPDSGHCPSRVTHEPLPQDPKSMAVCLLRIKLSRPALVFSINLQNKQRQLYCVPRRYGHAATRPHGPTARIPRLVARPASTCSAMQHHVFSAFSGHFQPVQSIPHVSTRASSMAFPGF
ncbi:hypothetical protein LZ30DRAFT_402875 [Colletotrichum cereale]|nr:hypothetical protein LZ30DRAFT_402875 [Colletotrichum cereale]